MKETVGQLRCDLCLTSGKRGYLWLGGKDYVECPQCFTTGRFEIVKQLHLPGRIYASGLWGPPPVEVQ